MAALCAVATLGVAAAHWAPIHTLVASPSQIAGELEWGAYVHSRTASPSPSPDNACYLGSAAVPLEPVELQRYELGLRELCGLGHRLRGGATPRKPKPKPKPKRKPRKKDTRRKTHSSRSADYRKRKNKQRRVKWRTKRASNGRARGGTRANRGVAAMERAAATDPTGNTGRDQDRYREGVARARVQHMRDVVSSSGSRAGRRDLAPEERRLLDFVRGAAGLLGIEYQPWKLARQLAPAFGKQKSVLAKYLTQKTHVKPTRGGRDNGRGRPSPNLLQKSLLCKVMAQLRKVNGKHQIPTYITDVMAAAGKYWEFGQTCARTTIHQGDLVGEKKRKWLKCRTKPQLHAPQRQKRMGFCRNLKRKTEVYFRTKVVFADCKSFTVRTSERQQRLGRAREYHSTYRGEDEGLLEETTRTSKFASQGGGKSVKVFAAYADGELILWRVYTKWDGAVAATITAELAAACRRKWPSRKEVDLMHDNDRSFNSAANAQAERDAGFALVEMPPRSPDFMPLDYAHWAWILNSMQQQEAAEGFQPQTRAQYLARLDATAHSIPKDVVDRAHGQMVDHIQKVFEARGGHIEDGRRGVSEVKNARKRKWSDAERRARFAQWEKQSPAWLTKELARYDRLVAQHAKVQQGAAPPSWFPSWLRDQITAPGGTAAADAGAGAAGPPKGAPPKGPAPKRPREETSEQAYQRKLRHHFPEETRLVVDSGMYALSGKLKQDNNCLYLSFLIGLSRLPEQNWPTGGGWANRFWDQVRGPLRELRDTPLRELRHTGRTSHADALGKAAGWLRKAVGMWLLTDHGRLLCEPFFDSDMDLAEGGDGTWERFVKGGMGVGLGKDTELAHEHQVRALSHLFGVRVVVIEDNPNEAPVPVYNPGSPHGDVYVGNNNVHYVALVKPGRR